MTKLITTDAGLFGPYEDIQALDDRLLVDGASELPFAVIGSWSILDNVELPAGFFAGDYEYVAGQLQLRQVAAD